MEALSSSDYYTIQNLAGSNKKGKVNSLPAANLSRLLRSGKSLLDLFGHLVVLGLGGLAIEAFHAVYGVVNLFVDFHHRPGQADQRN